MSERMLDTPVPTPIALHLHWRAGLGGPTVLALPHALDTWLHEAGQARKTLLRHVPAAFTRDEWAYLLGALEPGALQAQLDATLGPALHPDAGTRPRWLLQPRGEVAVWLPANVSLLGPLTMLAVALSGNRVRMKASTRAADLSSALLAELQRVAPGFATLLGQVRIDTFDRHDPRNAKMAATADVRIVFGADTTAREVHALPHPLESLALSFTDRRSEAWIELAALDDVRLRELVKVFAIYGQAGCTSPSRVVLLGARHSEALTLRERLLTLWPTVVRADVPMHTASENVKLCQLARTRGWDAELVQRHRAMVAVGDVQAERSPQGMAMWLVPATLDEALATLPPTIQTVGHVLRDAADPAWMQVVTRHRLRRWVPLHRMHHFGWTWDGEAFWRQLFRSVEYDA